MITSFPVGLLPHDDPWCRKQQAPADTRRSRHNSPATNPRVRGRDTETKRGLYRPSTAPCPGAVVECEVGPNCLVRRLASSPERTLKA